jgi:hypothetical protein
MDPPNSGEQDPASRPEILPRMLNDVFEGEEITVFTGIARDAGVTQNLGESDQWTFVFAMAYSRIVDGQLVDFDLTMQGGVKIVDKAGNQWDVFGQPLSGNEIQESLSPIRSSMGFWFNFASKYERVDVYLDGTVETMSDENASEGWLLDTRTVVDAAGRDGIPSLEYPRFVNLEEEEAQIVQSYSQRAIVVEYNGSCKVFPHAILDYHEIVNDRMDDLEYTLTYCPLAGTTQVYVRNDPIESFGVSGLLYNSTLLPYDRSTRSIWTQLGGLSVHGERKSEVMPAWPHIEVTGSVLSTLGCGEIEVLSVRTGHNRNYDSYPYGDYRQNDDFFIAPVNAKDVGGIPNKEVVFGIFKEGDIKIYRASSLP